MAPEVLIGNSSNNLLDGGNTGMDTLDGGAGNDTLRVSGDRSNLAPC